MGRQKSKQHKLQMVLNLKDNLYVYLESVLIALVVQWNVCHHPEIYSSMSILNVKNMLLIKFTNCTQLGLPVEFDSSSIK